jgi:hypothetical protein
MIRMTVLLIIALSSSVGFAQGAATQPGDDRASVFTAGSGDPAELFSDLEGAIWFGLAGLAVVGIFVFMHLSYKAHRRCRRGFEEIESALGIGSQSDA